MFFSMHFCTSAPDMQREVAGEGRYARVKVKAKGVATMGKELRRTGARAG